MIEQRWQPIETAPKDGTAILAVVRPYSFHPKILKTYQNEKRQFIFIAKFSTWDDCWRIAHNGEKLLGEAYMVPHLWMPLPEVKYVPY